MTWLLLAALLLLAGGLGPALWLSARGRPAERLAGLQQASAVTVLVLLLLTQAYGPSSAVVLPLVLVVLAFSGTLVFIRLLGAR
ncbi:monovalent cation/H+ antiporter complex subunit F [Amycolatopsis jiangsuensis]|uniref:Multisubunit Na+/H+ antiporter MnhF subunit n=1 Tax=Amycolatopsis jiangsuensis TaxID=1181879 RepID=A0A840IRF3_9PSEU|nr:hypothetical protein [Amycolatopsis jiangsuensis]MBB4684025.1 multisubunit Na+/H+ antiporter MnhF subunit [Amycolatopsis jiangsuensis]